VLIGVTLAMAHEPIDPLSLETRTWLAQAEPADQKRGEPQQKLLEQKLRLLGTYMDSPALVAVEKHGSQEARQQLEQARKHLETARVLFAQGDRSRTMAALDMGLRTASRASALHRKAGVPRSSEAMARNRYRTQLGQIRSFFRTLPEISSESRQDAELAGERRSATHLITKAERLAAKGRYREANGVLGEAYKATVAMLSRLRQGKTVVYSLNFATPSDELEYERRRNDSYEMLIQIMLQENPQMAETLRPLADRYVRESRALRTTADSQAAAGVYPAAIRSMESATQRLVRVLQAGGLPISQ
jgi:hypothetical protein